MTVQEYQERLEELEVQLNRETYRQHAGLPYDENRMEALAAAIEDLAGRALATLRQEDFPRPLFLATIAASRASDQTRLENEIFRVRNEGVAAEIEGELVNLSNLRLFNRRHVRDGERRRRALEALLQRVGVLTPLLQERFALSRDVYRPYGLTPLDVYLEEEGIDHEALTRLLEATADAAGPPFQRELQTFAQELLGRPPQFHDDFYVFGNVIFEPVDRFFRDVDFHRLFEATYRGLGFDLSRIQVDGEPREGKHASPVCFGVRIPHEVYILYQRTSPVADYTGYCHEMGHALHFASVDSSLTYTDRYLIPAGVAEIFSTLFETLGTTPLFLAEEVGLTEGVIGDLLRRERFMELWFLVFYAANSIFKLRYWTEDLTMAQADDLYASLYRRYTGLAMPGEYWQTHHVVSLYDVYAPSYLLAKVRMSELHGLLEAQFGERWWRRPEAGVYLRGRLMGPGREIPLGAISSLDPAPYLSRLGLAR